MQRDTAVRAVAKVLREEILSGDDLDRFLGSEEELLARLGVSRPTLRQAARMLEQEQILVVRRGVGGGFFARRPTPEAVSHTASVYLRTAGVDLRDLQRAHALVSVELARLAASNPAPNDRATLLEFVEEYQAQQDDSDAHAFLVATLEFGRRLADLAGSPTLALFVSVLNELATKPLGGAIFDDRRRIRAARLFQRELADAVRAGDAGRAVAAYRAFDKRVQSWMPPLAAAKKQPAAASE